jgi:hypothetical protein
LIPEILPHSVGIYTEPERISSNLHANHIPPMNQDGEGANIMVDGQFLDFSGKQFTASQLQ